MDWQGQLISLYLYICNAYSNNAELHVHRKSHYVDLIFSDEEAVTIFLYGIMDRKKTLKSIWEHATNYWKDWFPALPCYGAFVQRLNRISDCFPHLVTWIHNELPFDFGSCKTHLMDSMPIILAQRTRRFNARVAREIASPDGYCVTKRLYYYGLKLHAVACYRKGSLPVPARIELTPANVFDGKVFDEIRHYFSGKDIFADKAYQKQMSPVLVQDNVTLYTPVKKRKGQTELSPEDRNLSFLISSVRQPIESLFNWIEEKTGIQRASKVRSTDALMIHCWGKLAVAFFLLVFYY